MNTFDQEETDHVSVWSGCWIFNFFGLSVDVLLDQEVAKKDSSSQPQIYIWNKAYHLFLVYIVTNLQSVLCFSGLIST